MSQLPLPFDENQKIQLQGSYLDILSTLLSSDLNFQGNNDINTSHRIHSFPAKFPPQLPRKFINELTIEGDKVLDPMMGSGTTMLEAYLLGRQGVGFDIDPLALLISRVKVRHHDTLLLNSTRDRIIEEARRFIQLSPSALSDSKKKKFDRDTQKFLDYWFEPNTQLELFALFTEINKIKKNEVREFFLLVFSSIIITKTGGVSLAFDLAHTRPHRAKVVKSKNGNTILGGDLNPEDSRVKLLTKIQRSPLVEFEKRSLKIIKWVIDSPNSNSQPIISWGNAQSLPLSRNSIDLIITSPPYASNAIDYMRAHKFSLTWFGHSIKVLSQKRSTYIGGEGSVDLPFVELPDLVQDIIERISRSNTTKGRAIKRYYFEISLVLLEMYRVLKPGKAAIVVVGNSILAGHDTKIQPCMAEIGEMIGFEIPNIGIRQLDRNKRMLPISLNKDMTSQIQKRMHEEYVIGFYKPLES